MSLRKALQGRGTPAPGFLQYNHQPTQPTTLKVEKTPPCAGHDAFSQAIDDHRCWPDKDGIVQFAHNVLREEMDKLGIPWTSGYATPEAVAEAYDKFFIKS